MEVVGLGVLLFAIEGVELPEGVGVKDFETGVEGLSFCGRIYVLVEVPEIVVSFETKK
jgi:hypothetical protein